MCPVVCPLLPQLSRSGGDDGGTRCGGRSLHDRSLGSVLRPNPGSPDPARVRRPNRSWRVDETYVRVAGRWTYLYRAIDSAGNTIDFLLSPNRDLTAAKGFLQLALSAVPVRPRVINVDGHPAYATAVAELKVSGELSRKCRCRPSPYLNN